jgi:hypothetical protein
MKEELKLDIEDVTHENAIDLYRHEYYLEGELVGHSAYDSKGGYYKGVLETGGKAVYAASPEGIGWKLQKLLNNTK